MSAHTTLTEDDAGSCAAYLLDAMPAHERATFEQHLDGCAACSAEVDSLRATAGRLGDNVPDRPPSAAARAATLAAVARLPQETVGPPAVARPMPWRRSPATPKAGITPWTRATRTLAVAATVLGLATVGLGAVAFDRQQRIDELATSQNLLAQVLRSDDARTLTAAAPKLGASLTAVVSGNRAVILADGLPALPHDSDYQLWVRNADGIVPAGLVDQRDGRATVLVEGVQPGGDLMLSIEPAGGSRQPTTAPVWQIPT